MASEKLDISSFVKAVSRLEEGLEQYTLHADNDIYRDALIQRFEFTYELSHRMLKRYLEMTTASADLLDQMSFADLIRTGNEQGLLLHDWSQWRLYREKRNKTSHTYNEEMAKDVVSVIPDFLRDARFLRDKLIERGHE